MNKQIAILGASGYTGAELVRLVQSHPNMDIVALAADRKAGQPMASVFPHLAHLELPNLVRIEDINYSKIDLVFCGLPHGVAQDFVRTVPDHVKIVDLSPDFRLQDGASYEKWYRSPHKALDLQASAVLGLPEVYRDHIKTARIVANTGCFVATSLLPLIPALKGNVIESDPIIIDAKSGVSGAGRGLNEPMLYSEANEGFKAYGVAHHRHMGELDQELSKAAGTPVCATFTPHLVPMTRGMQATIYAKGNADSVRAHLASVYKNEPFVHVLEAGEIPQTQHVKGSNLCRISVFADRQAERVIILSVLDNLMKGASGQAVQNANIMLDLPETAGLGMVPVFP